jgi:hypothetical protein
MLSPSDSPAAHMSAFAFLTPQRRFRLCLALILGLAAFLRFYHLNGYGLWSDEFVTLMIVSVKSWRDLIHTCFEIPQPMPPLYFLLAKVPVVWFGPSEVSLRLVSAVSNLLTVYGVFAIGRRLFSSEIGLFGALLCALDTTQIVYAQNARPYSLCLLLSCASILAFLRFVRTKDVQSQFGYVISTSLLLYTHYVFFPLLLIQNLFFVWKKRTCRSDSCEEYLPSWKQWLVLQGIVGLLLTPLVPQIATILCNRYSLNWSKELPHYSDFFCFFNGRFLFFASATTLTVMGLCLFLKGVWKGKMEGASIQGRHSADNLPGNAFPGDPFIFLMLWYLVPVALFFYLAKGPGLNLFVERYLILSALPTFLIIAAVPFGLTGRNLARLFLVIYVLHYAYMEPGGYYREKREFSQGVPGANEWRETLAELRNPAYHAPLLLFQSPFIESNQLEFSANPRLFHYLSSPLDSFYVKDDRRDFVLVPVHWWYNNEKYLQFKAKIKSLILRNPDVAVLSTQEFWDSFRPWLEQEFSQEYQIRQVGSFRSTGALRLNRVRLFRREAN